MKNKSLLVMLVFVPLILVGCATSPTPTPVPPTPVPPTLTLLPPTATPVPPTITNTPKPTDTPRPIETPTLGMGSTKLSPIDGAPMVYVPAGNFLMGSSDSDREATYPEKPQHTVYLDAFWIDKFEVTNALYKKCVDQGKCPAPSESKSSTRHSYYGNTLFDNYPVIYVFWDDANKYCAWAGKHLPTEAQWEKAARGTDDRIYSWGNTWNGTYLNACDKNCTVDFGSANRDTSVDDKYAETAPVGSYPAGASPYGAMDMLGNVYEWVADWSSNSYPSGVERNPTGPASGQARVIRGGAWGFGQMYARVGARNQLKPNASAPFTGFRCAQ